MRRSGILKPRGRVASLLAWGLLIGGVALLVTFPDAAPPRALGARHMPAAILFALGGVVFGLSHPEGRAWASAFVLGWVPPVAAMVAAARGASFTVVWLAIVAAPAVLAAAGGWAGAMVARRR